jgi:hypothetical protein
MQQQEYNTHSNMKQKQNMFISFLTLFCLYRLKYTQKKSYFYNSCIISISEKKIVFIIINVKCFL